MRTSVEVAIFRRCLYRKDYMVSAMKNEGISFTYIALAPGGVWLSKEKHNWRSAIRVVNLVIVESSTCILSS